MRNDFLTRGSTFSHWDLQITSLVLRKYIHTQHTEKTEKKYIKMLTVYLWVILKVISVSLLILLYSLHLPF